MSVQTALRDLSELSRFQAAVRPERVAITFEGHETTYGQLDRRANRVANGLLAACSTTQARIAVLDKNSDQFFELLIGATCKLEDELMEAGSAPAAGDALPPGPEEPELTQSMRWASEPLPMLEQCHERFGDTFTLRLRHLGTWVVLADPEGNEFCLGGGSWG